MPQLANKVAVVTGAGTGLGAATARALAREGADVVLVGRRPEKLEETASTLSDPAERPLVVAGDVGEEATAGEFGPTAFAREGRSPWSAAISSRRTTTACTKRCRRGRVTDRSRRPRRRGGGDGPVSLGPQLAVADRRHREL